MGNSNLHTYCVMKISQMKLSQTALAALCGCSVPVINQIITGRRTSERIQGKIAKHLNHSSWDELVQTSELFGSFILKADLKVKEINSDIENIGNQRRIS
ncbi:MAG: helix-turn-helix domain-containing protein [Pleomorphochaeta sp.]